MGRDWNKCQSSNIWGVFWMNRTKLLLEGSEWKESWLLSGNCLTLGVYSLSVRGSCEEFSGPDLLYDSETVVWREKEKSRIKAVQMDNL